jgi:hypothetical protein
MARESDSVGLKGAKRIGDKKVSSLLHFSWSTRHDRTLRGVSSHGGIKIERKDAHGEPAVSEKRQRTKG